MSIQVTDKTAPTTGPSADFRHVSQRFGSYDNQDAGKQLFFTSDFAALMAADGTITNPAAIGGTAAFDWWKSGACPVDDSRAFIVGAVGTDFTPDGGAHYFYNTAAWFFDWSTGAFTAATAPPTATEDNFGQPICTRLADGRVFVYLGIGVDLAEHCYIFDPAGAGGSGTWTAVDAWPGPNEPFTEMCLLPSGRVLAVGDSASAVPSKEFDPATGHWSNSVNGPDRGNTSDLRIPLRLLHSGLVAMVMSCGFVSLYDPATKTWTDQPQYSSLSYNGNWVVEYQPNKLMIGDMSLSGAPRLLYDIDSQTWDTLPQTIGLLEVGGWLTAGVWFGVAFWRNMALQFFSWVNPTPNPTYTPPTPRNRKTGRDFKVDLDTKELILENGDLVLVDGIDAIAQDCHLALGTFLGEWFADENEGVPWFQAIFVKNASQDRIRAALRDRLLGRAGIVSVDRLDLDIDRSARTLTVGWSATSDLGTVTGSRALPAINL